MNNRKAILSNLSGDLDEPANPVGDMQKAVQRDINRPRPIARKQIPALRSYAAGTQEESRAEELDKLLASGQAIVDLDTALLDPSPFQDRMVYSQKAHDDLVEAIEAEGQQVPILVRPHPSQEGRYQIAYGHRRYYATKHLGIPVRAVVRELTDEQLLLAQGQENSVRTELSWIEKARFAAAIAAVNDKKNRTVEIKKALNVNDAEVSKLLSVVKAIPDDIIMQIGPAPGIGRRRWMELADLLEGVERQDIVRRDLQSFDPFQTKMKSDDDQDTAEWASVERFKRVVAVLTSKPETATDGPAKAQAWTPANCERPIAKVKDDGDRFALIVDKKVAPEFGNFLLSKLEGLYAEFTATTSVVPSSAPTSE